MFSNDDRGSEIKHSVRSMPVCAEREKTRSRYDDRTHTSMEKVINSQHNLPGRFLHDCRCREGGCRVKWRTNQNGRL